MISASVFTAKTSFYFKGNEIKAILGSSEVANKLKVSDGRVIGQPNSLMKMFLAVSAATCV